MCEKEGAILVVDESFLEFVSQAVSARALLKKYESIVILQSFTKIYAMPGLRLGCAFCGKESMVELLQKRLQPWNVSLPAQYAGIAAMQEKEYVEAAKASGASPFYIITRHLIPNCISTIIVLVTLGIPNAIMYEASLSFLGLGIQPPTPSWGSMISFAQSYISYLPGYSIFPGLAIMITVIAFNIFGDGLRDALDPKMKNQ